MVKIFIKNYSSHLLLLFCW